MIVSPFQLAAGFMFLCTLLLLGIIYGRLHWVLKSMLVSVSLLFCFLAFHGYQSTLGYPVSVTPPQVFKLEYMVIHEPAPVHNDPGALYLWLVDPKGRSEPRAVILPYSKENREALAAAKKRIQAGQTVYMSLKDKKVQEGEGTTPGNRPTDTGSGRGSNSVPYFLKDKVLDFEQPPDTLPKKDGDSVSNE